MLLLHRFTYLKCIFLFLLFFSVSGQAQGIYNSYFTTLTLDVENLSFPVDYNTDKTFKSFNVLRVSPNKTTHPSGVFNVFSCAPSYFSEPIISELSDGSFIVIQNYMTFANVEKPANKSTNFYNLGGYLVYKINPEGKIEAKYTHQKFIDTNNELKLDFDGTNIEGYSCYASKAIENRKGNIVILETRKIIDEGDYAYAQGHHSFVVLKELDKNLKELNVLNSTTESNTSIWLGLEGAFAFPQDYWSDNPSYKNLAKNSGDLIQNKDTGDYYVLANKLAYPIINTIKTTGGASIPAKKNVYPIYATIIKVNEALSPSSIEEIDSFERIHGYSPNQSNLPDNNNTALVFSFIGQRLLLDMNKNSIYVLGTKFRYMKGWLNDGDVKKNVDFTMFKVQIGTSRQEIFQGLANIYQKNYGPIYELCESTDAPCNTTEYNSLSVEQHSLNNFLLYNNLDANREFFALGAGRMGGNNNNNSIEGATLSLIHYNDNSTNTPSENSFFVTNMPSGSTSDAFFGISFTPPSSAGAQDSQSLLLRKTQYTSPLNTDNYGIYYFDEQSKKAISLTNQHFDANEGVEKSVYMNDKGVFVNSYMEGLSTPDEKNSFTFTRKIFLGIEMPFWNVTRQTYVDRFKDDSSSGYLANANAFYISSGQKIEYLELVVNGDNAHTVLVEPTEVNTFTAVDKRMYFSDLTFLNTKYYKIPFNRCQFPALVDSAINTLSIRIHFSYDLSIPTYKTDKTFYYAERNTPVSANPKLDYTTSSPPNTDVWKKSYGNILWNQGHIQIMEMNANKDIFLVSENSSGININKLDEQGDTIWSESKEDPNYNYTPKTIVPKPNGGVRVFGNYSHLTATSNTQDIGGYILDMDNQGNIISFVRDKIGLTNTNLFISSAVNTTNEGYIMVGYTQEIGNGSIRPFLKKVDNKGNTLFEKQYGLVNDIAKDIIKTIQGDYIILGETQNYGTTNSSILLSKIDATGAHIWTKTVGNNVKSVYKIVKTEDNHFFILGTGNNPNISTGDVKVWKIDNSGNMIWEKTISIPSGEIQILDIIACKGGGFFLCGKGVENSLRKPIVLRLDKDGNILWDKTYEFDNKEGIALNVLQKNEKELLLANINLSDLSADLKSNILLDNKTYSNPLANNNIALFDLKKNEYIENNASLCLGDPFALVIQNPKQIFTIDYTYLPKNRSYQILSPQSLCLPALDDIYTVTMDWEAIMENNNNSLINTITFDDNSIMALHFPLNIAGFSSESFDFDFKYNVYSTELNFTSTDTSNYFGNANAILRTWTLGGLSFDSQSSIYSTVLVANPFTLTLYAQAAPRCEIFSVSKSVICPSNIKSEIYILNIDTNSAKPYPAICQNEEALIKVRFSDMSIFSTLTVRLPDNSIHQIGKTEINTSSKEEFSFSIKTNTLALGQNVLLMTTTENRCYKNYVNLFTLDYATESLSLKTDIESRVCSSLITFTSQSSGKYPINSVTWYLSNNQVIEKATFAEHFVSSVYVYTCVVKDAANCSLAKTNEFDLRNILPAAITPRLFNKDKNLYQDHFYCAGDDMELRFIATSLLDTLTWVNGSKAINYLGQQASKDYLYVLDTNLIPHKIYTNTLNFNYKEPCATKDFSYDYDYHKIEANFDYFNPICDENVVILSDTSVSSHPLDLFQWQTDVREFFSNVLKMKTSPESLPMSFTVSDKAGCSDSIERTLVVLPSEFLSFTLVDFNSCLNETVTIKRNSIKRIEQLGIPYIWYINGKLFHSGREQEIQVSAEDFTAHAFNDFKLVAIVSNKEQCEAEETIEVRDKLSPNFTLSGNETILCEGHEYKFDNHSQNVGRPPIYDVYVSLPDSNQRTLVLSTDSLTSFSYYFPLSNAQQHTDYDVQLSMHTDICIQTHTFKAIIYRVPRIQVLQSDLYFCEYNDSPITPLYSAVDSSDYGDWKVSINGSELKNYRFYPKDYSEGTHRITVTRENAYCQTSSFVDFHIIPRPQIHFNSPKLQFGEYGQLEVVLDKVGTDTYSFNWSPNIPLDQRSSLSPQFPLKEKEFFTFRITDSVGCTNETSITIQKFDDSEVPNFITKGNNSQNNTIDLRFMYDFFPQATMYIFSMSGRLIYQSTPNNRDSFLWNPSIGKDYPQGHYMLYVDYGNNKKENYSRIFYLFDAAK